MNCSFLTLVRQLSSQSQRVSAIPLSVQLRLQSSPISSALSSSSSSIFSRSSALSNNFQHREFSSSSFSSNSSSPNSSTNSSIFSLKRKYVYGALAALALVDLELYVTETYPFNKKNKKNSTTKSSNIEDKKLDSKN